MSDFKDDIEELRKCLSGVGLSIAVEILDDVAAELDRLTAENTRIRAALATSSGACVYCSLTAEEWAKCSAGFPGCARADDAMGCPELGARLELEQLKADLAAAEARAEELEAGLRDVVNGWEALPMGNHSPLAVERWLKSDVHPAIQSARKLLENKP